MASSLVANARTGSLRARMRRPALVNKWTLNGAGSGSSVGLFGVRAFTLSQQKRRAESRRSVRPALSELFVCGAASDPDALRYRAQPILALPQRKQNPPRARIQGMTQNIHGLAASALAADVPVRRRRFHMAPFKRKPRQPAMTKAQLREQGVQALAQATTPIIKLPMKIRRQCVGCGDFNSVLVEPGEAVPPFKCSVCGYPAV